MRLLLLFLISVLTTQVYGQQYRNVVEEADDLLLNSKAKEAIQLLDEALQKSTSTEDKQALQIKKTEALVSNQELEKAQVLITALQAQTLATKQQADLASVTGMLALYQGRNDLAEEHLVTALKLFEETNDGNSLSVARALTTLGLTYFNTGKYAQAQEQLTMALSIRSKLLPPQHELLAASYNDLGLVFSRTDQDKALSYYEKALPIYETIHGKTHPKIAINNTNTGAMYAAMELYGDAINNLESALGVWNKLSSSATPGKAFVLYNLGYTYQRMRNNDNARLYYQQSLDEYRKCYGEKHPDIANVLNALGSLESAKGAYDKGLLYFHQALQSNLKNFSTSEISVIPRAADYYSGNYLLYSLMNKAQTFEARHFNKSLRFSDLEKALANLLVCDTLIDKLRQQSNNENDKIALGALATEIYGDGVRIATHMSEIAFTRRSTYREKAFYFAEKSKSAVLLEAISDVSAKSFAGVPAELLEEENALKSSIALCAQRLSQKPSAEEESYLRETMFALNRQYQTFVDQLETNYPEYFNLKFNTIAPTIAALQKVVDSKTALISYFIDDNHSKDNRDKQLYIFIITHKNLELIHKSIPGDFDKLLTGFRNGIYYNDRKTIASTGSTLHKLLMPKLPSSITNLVVFPAGRLAVIPFEALVTNRSAATDQPLSYLIQQFAVRYEFSAALALQKAGKASVANSSILLCAPVSFQESDNLSSLPGTEEEVKAIASLFQQRNASATTLLASQANETAIKSEQLKDYDVLHFATHGVVDESNPELSRIFLQTNSGAEDGHLFSGEIYNLKVNANLVTLSACQTGLGKISKGEGVIGLSRALVYSGAKNIVVSYWSVADQSTSTLMADFYATLLSNSRSYSDALRDAKLAMLKHQTYKDPYFWAPFVLIGF
jgi:tetratricopeptide (TPR) repeat protein